MRTLVLALLLCALSATAGAQDGQGQGGGTGKGGDGQARQRASDPHCGRDMVVVKPDGTRERHDSVARFMAKFPHKDIDQGESLRPAVNLDDVLRAYNADWVEALDCSDRSVQLPGGMPVRYVEYFVLTGRGTLKGIREVGPGRYANTIQPVRKLTFHAASGKAAAPAQKPKK